MFERIEKLDVQKKMTIVNKLLIKNILPRYSSQAGSSNSLNKIEIDTNISNCLNDQN